MGSDAREQAGETDTWQGWKQEVLFIEKLKDMTKRGRATPSEESVVCVWGGCSVPDSFCRTQVGVGE